MRAPSADRITKPLPDLLSFENGDKLDQKTFHALYEQCDPRVKAELIEGIVYVASPTSSRHGRPHARVVHWLSLYEGETHGVAVCDNTTNILRDESEPQPDAMLFILSECGGQIRFDDKGYIHGAAELVAEVAYSSAAIDLHAKRRDYERAGVREYFVALAESETVVRFARRGGKLAERPADADAVFRSAAFPGLWLDPAGLFSPTTRPLTAALRRGVASPEHAAFAAKLETKRAAAARRNPKGKTPDA